MQIFRKNRHTVCFTLEYTLKLNEKFYSFESFKINKIHDSRFNILKSISFKKGAKKSQLHKFVRKLAHVVT